MNTIDIDSIHQSILNDYKNYSENVENNTKWKTLYEEIENNVSNDVLKDLKKYAKKNDDISSYQYYLISAIPILEEFSQCKEKMEKISFIKTANSTQSEKYKLLIEKYLFILNKFFPKKYDSLWKTSNLSSSTSLVVKKKK